MTEVAEPLTSPIEAVKPPTTVVLSPWEVYFHSVAEAKLKNQGIKTPKIREIEPVNKDGLRYDSHGRVLPIGLSELEVEEGDFLEFEMVRDNLLAEMMMGKNGEEVSVFKKHPSSLTDAEKETLESDIDILVGAVITAVKHAPSDELADMRQITTPASLPILE